MSNHITVSIALTIMLATLFRYPANVPTGEWFSIRQCEAALADNNFCAEDEMKDFLILSFLRDHIAEAIKDYYGYYKPYMNETITGIEKLGGEYRIGVRLETFNGAHNPPYGIDTMTVIKDFKSVRVENFEHDEVPPWSLYLNDKYHISLKYPAGWTKAPRCGEWYSGTDGYFFVTPLGGGVYLKPDNIETVVRNVLDHKLHIYGISQLGPHPKVEVMKIRDQDAILITDHETADSSDNMGSQSILVIKCPGPFEVDDRMCHYLVLAADSEHIMKIAKTVKLYVTYPNG